MSPIEARAVKTELAKLRVEREIVEERLHPLLTRRNELTYGRLFLNRSVSSFEVSSTLNRILTRRFNLFEFLGQILKTVPSFHFVRYIQDLHSAFRRFWVVPICRWASLDMRTALVRRTLSTRWSECVAFSVSVEPRRVCRGNLPPTSR